MTTTVAPYRDPGLTPRERVADLLPRMTAAERVAQLGSVWAFELFDDGSVDRERLAALVPEGIGEITRLAGSTELGPVEVACAANEIQRFLVEETRLGIPAIVHEECLHGLLAFGAPCFQQSIGAAASFDAEAVAAVAATIRRRMLATGARHALGPVLDIGRDARWGRIEETYGEDPYLAAELGAAYVRALQGFDLGDSVVATGKHMVGHGLAEGGMNQAPAHVGLRELRDEQLLPFEAAVRETRLASIMPAYCDVDGVPCHASGELLTRILRDEWGFDGVVASDYIGITMLRTAHRLTSDPAATAALALSAGVDLELPSTVTYGDPLLAALTDGRIDRALVDRAVERVLRLKFELGLFERPYVGQLTDADLDALQADERAAALDLAQRSLVLLANNGLLPLDPVPSRVAVIGPIADSARDLLGDYSHVVHMQTLREMRDVANALGADTDRLSAKFRDELSGRRTILDAIRDRLPSCELIHAAGTGIHTGTDAQMADAVDAARRAEIAIVVVGERSGLTDDSTTGEFRDRRDLSLHGRQQELLEAVVSTGTPVVLVVISGRPLALEWAAGHCAAILLGWVPGDAGPDAIADALVGAANPGGKLPVSFPRHVGQMPLTYRHHPTGGRSSPKGDYVDGSTRPLWPFGFGLSYTTFELTELQVDRAAVSTDGGEFRVTVDVVNTGRHAGDEVVQLYARDEEATVARPVLELIGFRRVELAPGERRTVTFRVAAEQLAYTGADYRRIVEPGRVTLWVGRSSDDRPLTTPIELTGPTVTLDRRHRYFTETTIS
jgi:beta-glucosidase